MNEKNLGIAIHKGDEKAFKHLFELHYQSLVSFLTTYTQDKAMAEDFAQQAFFTLWEKRKSLKEGRSPKHYLFTVGHNLFIDHYRHQKTIISSFAELKHQALVDHIEEDKEYLEQRIARLKEIIEELPPNCREILRLSKMQGLQYKEIADHLGISQKTVESQMRIAFQKIRESFDKNDPVVLFFLLDILQEIVSTSRAKYKGETTVKFQ